MSDADRADEIVKSIEEIERIERDLSRVASARTRSPSSIKPMEFPLVDRLAAYCRNRDYCRRELKTLLPFYGNGLKELILEAVEKNLPVDELVALLARRLTGSVTDDDIYEFLEHGRMPRGVVPHEGVKRPGLFSRMFRRLKSLFSRRSA